MPRPWTVLPHDPIEKLQPNLWSVESALPKSPIRRRMGVARFAGGQLVFLNAIPLDDPSMKEIESWGAPSFVIAGNGFHRLDLAAYRARYPQLKILSHPVAAKRVAQITPVDGWLELLPRDAGVRLENIGGGAEAVCVATSGGQATLAFPGDLLANQRPLRGIGGLIASLAGFVGDLRVPRLMKWIGVKDKRALREHLLKLADTPGLQRLFTCHGPVISIDPAGALRKAALAI
ncbi:MAG: hypothetical protein ABR567_02700 [Myxococcales bacterium]|nr:hypothetical protein [Myxococcales bacterium]